MPSDLPTNPTQQPNAERAWDALLAARAWVRAAPTTASFDHPLLRWRAAAGWEVAAGTHALLSLYLPLCAPLTGATTLVIGHLGQSLDGCIATATGESRFINDPANIVHLHRLRALCDAVIVGAGTVAADDPRLTTRAVPGPSPLRVILDPDRRLPASCGVFQDAAAPTLLCCRADRAHAPAPGRAEVLGLPEVATEMDHDALLAALRERGCQRLFVEGGGVTVSRFLREGLLTRLQIAVAPVIIGGGRRGIALPPVLKLADARRPAVRIWRMGRDLLYDLDLTAGQGPTAEAENAEQSLPVRIY